ncbi:MAG: ABC transporter substrate-binding protein [Alphaproteobacteria bacterium]|nr:ABC transporter substrate-binding protein [Alphaproteobacteria bacterium]
MRFRVFTGYLAAVTLATATWFVSSAAAEGPVKIGVMNDQSSIYADLSGLGGIAAVRMAIEDFGGKVLGQPIQLVTADMQNKADVAVNLANKWYDEDKVDVIVDVPNSAADLALQEIARQKKRLLIVSTGATSDFTGKKCSPYGIHWTYDTYALAAGTGRAMVQQGGKSWYFITADYAFGHALQRDTAKFVTEAGGTVLGSVDAPFPNQDFSSYLLKAQGSGAQVIALANAGGDTINSIKQAKEFGIFKSGKQRLAALLIFISDVHSLGLEAAQGIVLTTGFYWDLNSQTRAWSKRFFAKRNAMPTMTQAGNYSAVMHYLKAVQAAGTKDPLKVAAKMREMPVNDFFAKNGHLRVDGRMVHDMYLVQVKSPKESKYPWDYYKVLRTIPGDQAFRPLNEGGCPLVSAK